MIRRALMTFAVIFFTAEAQAEEKTPLALPAARAEAREHAPDAAELLARLRGARGIADDAGRALRRDPSLSVTARPGAVAGEPDEYGFDIGLSWTFDISGSWRSRERSALADRDAAEADRENGLRALDEMVALALANVAVAQRALARSEKIVTLHVVAVDAAKKKLDAGEGNQLDVDGAELDLAAARASVVRAGGDQDTARVQLGRLLGRARHDDLAVDDPIETTTGPSQIELEALVDRDPRARAARAEVRAADEELQSYQRLMWPAPTFGVGYGFRRRVISPSGFAGPSAGGLSAAWTDSDIGFTLTVPIPIFDRQTQPRMRASGRKWNAEARLESIRANVRAELETYTTTYRAAAAALAALAQTAAIVDRDFDLLDKAVRAGALDAVSRALSLRRLEEAGRRYDTAVYDVRVARARWIRRTAGLP